MFVSHPKELHYIQSDSIQRDCCIHLHMVLICTDYNKNVASVQFVLFFRAQRAELQESIVIISHFFHLNSLFEEDFTVHRFRSPF